MKEWIIKHKNEIITGIVVAIIMGVIQWIWQYIKQGLPIAGNAILTTLINSLYSAAAIQNSGSSSLIILIILFGLFFGAILSLLLKLWKVKKERAKYEKLQTRIQQLAELDDESSAKGLNERIKEIEALVETTKPKQGKKIFRIIAVVLVCLYIIWGFVTMVYPVMLWNNFEIYTTQIKPYISEPEMDMLKSKWTLMRSKEDFDDINNYILKIRQENGLLQ